MLEVLQIQDHNQFTDKLAGPSTIINVKQVMVKQLEEQYQTITKAKRIIYSLSTINQKQQEEFEKAKVEFQKEKKTQINRLLEQIQQLEELNKTQVNEQGKLKQELSNQKEDIKSLEKQILEYDKENSFLKQQNQDQRIFYQDQLEEKTINHENSLKRIDELTCQGNQFQQLQQETQIFNQNQLMESNNLQSQAIPQHEFQQITDESSKSDSDGTLYEKVSQEDENQNECQSTLQQNNSESMDENQFMQNQKVEEQQTQIDQIINTNIITDIKQKEEIAQDQMISLNERPYQLIDQNTKQLNLYCRAIAFNKESTIMVAGQYSNIVVFDFNNGQLNQKQILSTSNYVNSFYFMKKDNQFISGNADGNIQIWNYNDTKQEWYCLQLLNKAHSKSVNRVIMNKNEDLIISCSHDKTIKFWIKRNEWECYQTLTNHGYYVLSISLNESCNQLVSCSLDEQILISQQDSEQKWTVIQSIESNLGYRICFIDDYLIAFQPMNGTEMELYELDEQNKQFVQSKDIPVQNDKDCYFYFPMTFHSKKQLLLNKNGFTINLMRKKNNDFVVEQSIKFGGERVSGAMTDDGEYLVTWDYYTEEFQVRKQL